MASTDQKQATATDEKQYATINDLPEEMLEHCCKYASVESLKALRLTYKKISPAATKQLFRHVEVKQTESSTSKCESLSSCEYLRNQVTSIAIHTSLNSTAHPDNNYNGADFEEWRSEIDLSEDLESVLLDVGKFNNLNTVELYFAMACVGLEDDMNDTPETHTFRTAVLTSLVKGLRHNEHPATKIRHLTIKNMQNVVPEELVAMPEFAIVLSGLESLNLQIATEFHDPAPECNLDYPEVHQFFAVDLKKYILQPLSSNLRHLNLCTAEMEWGFHPPFDLRGVHFPKLVSLALGRVMFTYDWQLDWIIAHGKTLEVLDLTDCLILAAGDAREDVENPATGTKDGFQGGDSDEDNRWVYNTRWHDYFSQFQYGLPLLKRFVMHSSTTMSKLEGLGGLEALSRSGAEINTSVYGIWRDVSVYKAIDTDEGPDWEMDDDEDGIPAAPNCLEEDKKALGELLETVRARTG